MTRFLHTADWQIGKPFGAFDPETRARLDAARLAVIARIATLATEHQAAFVLVAGDLFDSPRPTRRLASATLQAIGRIPTPVHAIPGNHDHAAHDSVWRAPWFADDRAQLAPNLHVHLDTTPVHLPGATLLPCPLLQRASPADPTAWLRHLDPATLPADPPRIVLAHGSALDFGSADADAPALHLDRIPRDLADYIALGDWHGARPIAPHAWYAGTPEPDRFPKGDDYTSGVCLLVSAERGATPRIQQLATGSVAWSEADVTLDAATATAALASHPALPSPQRVHQDIVRLTLRGTLPLDARRPIDDVLDTLRARLLHLDLDDQLVAEPSAEELAALTQRPGDPLLARVAANLAAAARDGGPAAAEARAALQLLHAELTR